MHHVDRADLGYPANINNTCVRSAQCSGYLCEFKTAAYCNLAHNQSLEFAHSFSRKQPDLEQPYTREIVGCNTINF